MKLEQKTDCNEPTPMSKLQSTAEEEIVVNTSFNSCLYLQASAFNQHSKFLLDTGSLCSVLSNKIYNKVPKDKNIQRKDECTKLRAADGSLIETSGKVIVPLLIEPRVHSCQNTWY